MSAPTDCPLCAADGGTLVWKDQRCRVILADEPDYPGFVRVILNQHRAEMTELAAADRSALMEVVWRVETVLRERLAPAKINLASLGNVVPHLHWHVIPRWRDDRHYPNPIWGAPQREAPPRPIDLAALRAALVAALAD